jgi:hypothetical protein
VWDQERRLSNPRERNGLDSRRAGRVPGHNANQLQQFLLESCRPLPQMLIPPCFNVHSSAASIFKAFVVSCLNPVEF